MTWLEFFLPAAALFTAGFVQGYIARILEQGYRASRRKESE